MQSKVSIIIPIFNAEKYLEQCIESAINQTIRDIEIILINDGSTDSSEVICKKYASQDSRIIYYYKENEGLAAARQDGIERASGEYIGFIDSDDWVEPEMYEKMYVAAQSNNADVVLCNCFEYSEKKRGMGIEGGAYDEGQIKATILPQTLIRVDENGNRRNIRWSNCLRIYRRSTIEENNIKFDRRFRRCQDLPFTLDVMLHSKNFYYLDEFLYHNRQDAGSLSRGYTKNMWELMKPLIRHIDQSVKDYHEVDFSQFADSTAFFLTLDCILNEFKDDAPGYREKMMHIRSIIDDQLCVEILNRFNGAMLNSAYRKIFYVNMKKQKTGKLIFDYYYYRSSIKKKVAPLMNLLTENAVYKTLRYSRRQ